MQKLVYVKIQCEQSQDGQNCMASNYMVLDVVDGFSDLAVVAQWLCILALKGPGLHSQSREHT